MRIGFPVAHSDDNPFAPKRMLEKTDVDYLSMDYIAEAVLPSLVRNRANDPSRGYVESFPPIIEKIEEELVNSDVKVVTNAGAFNPESCARALDEALDTSELTIATITGDDVLDDIDSLREKGHEFDNMDTGDSFGDIQDNLMAANAYLGSFPLSEALDQGADIVIGGRIVDPGLVLAPLIHEYDWGPTDYNLLASGLTAGHILECGAQSTGGQLEHWWKDIDLRNAGNPIAEVTEDGDFVVTKPEGTGGAVTENTVKAQMAYEIKDPGNYYMPDVTVDLTTPTVEQVGEDRVAVRGCEGKEPPETLKLAMLYSDGYRAEFMNLFSWPDALEKARAGEEIVLNQVEGEIEKVETEIIGHDTTLGKHAPERDMNEVVFRFAGKDNDPQHLDEITRSARLDTSAPPTATHIAKSGPTEIFSYWPTSIPREEIEPEINILRPMAGVA